MKKNTLALFLCISWGILAAMNLVEFFTFYDYDKLTIAMLEGLICMKDYIDYRKSVN